MRCACIDIGSNTTRLLVAEVGEDGGLTPLRQERAFTRLGRAVRARGELGAQRRDELVAVVAAQAAVAHRLGAPVVVAVATSAVRDAADGEALVAEVRARVGLDLRILGGEEEAELAFAGACRTLSPPADGELGVVDVGGGSCELAVGTRQTGVSWSRSLRLGSCALTEGFLHADPPRPAELAALRDHVAEAFSALDPPRPRAAVAVGSGAASLPRLAGSVLDAGALARALGQLADAPAAVVARRWGLEPERVRLLPAGMLVLAEAGRRMGRPLDVARGGLREGVVLVAAERAAAETGAL